MAPRGPRRRPPSAAPLLLLLQLHLLARVFVASLSVERRAFLARCGGGLVAASPITSCNQHAFADDRNNGNSDSIASLLDAKTISWDGPPFASARYGTSTLRSSNNDGNTGPTSGAPCIYPPWLEGYHAITYKFVGASFPQGRKALSLRVAGAGLGTCLSLPNVGYNPPDHAVHFVPLSAGGGAYEDLAYNTPRKLEGFWPQATVLAVQTNGRTKGASSTSSSTSDGGTALSPKCFVTGDGCTPDVNPNLHSPTSRVALEFEGPTVRGGRQIQSIDTTLLNCSRDTRGETYYSAKGFSQYNALQGLQTFYREVSSLHRKDEETVEGRIRVAAFLPEYINDVGGGASAGASRNDEEALAVYDYSVSLKRIDEAEAASL
ncbi:hypothetical protein ACHAXT_005971 [Thalassiosira profunda]